MLTSEPRGFTLIELVIALAVIAILTASAVPSFTDFLRRGRITEAVTRLADYRARMEQYFLDHRRYDDGAGNCGASAQAATPADAFTVACSADADVYTVTATGLVAKGMHGFVYTVDHANARKTTSVPRGWLASDLCWVMRRDGSCV
jgi:type IV pilus assembly protein PilE